MLWGEFAAHPPQLRFPLEDEVVLEEGFDGLRQVFGAWEEVDVKIVVEGDRVKGRLRNVRG